jgi:hypothetical protein
LEDNPPPEDPKLKEKLVDYYGNFANAEDMLIKLESNFIHDIENSESLLKFEQIFGKFDSISGKGLKTTFEIRKNKKSEVQSQIKAVIDKYLSFLQISRDRDIANMK